MAIRSRATFMMKLLLTLTAVFAKSLLAQEHTQEPAAVEKPVPAENAPAAPEKKPDANDLPLLPEPSPGSEQHNILNNQPSPGVLPTPQIAPGWNKKNTGNQTIPGRSILRPPTTSEDLEQRIRYRQIRSLAEADPKLKAIWEESRSVKTDFAKRELLKKYYQGLFTKMLATDKRIAPLIQTRRQVAMRRLDQTRIDPTDPVEDDLRYRRE